MQLQPRPTHLGMSLVWVAVVRRRGFHHGSRVMGDERQDIDQQKVCKQKCKCKFNMKELYNWISKSYLMSSYFLQIKKVTFFFSVWIRLVHFPKKSDMTYPCTEKGGPSTQLPPSNDLRRKSGWKSLHPTTEELAKLPRRRETFHRSVSSPSLRPQPMSPPMSRSQSFCSLPLNGKQRLAV